MEEWFSCPECGTPNLILWGKGQSTREVSCIACRRTIGGPGQEDLCSCDPKPMIKIATGRPAPNDFVECLAIHDHGWRGTIDFGKGHQEEEKARKV